jgi:type IV pilus assembly protein PilN
MIRINLLAVERVPVKRTVLIPAAHRVTIAAGFILLLTVMVIGGWFWSLRRTSAQVDRDIARAENDIFQMRGVLVSVQQFDAQRAQLQQRVTLIEQLRRGQTGPVHVIDEIAKALPERTWLYEMVQKGNDVTLAGMTTSNMGVSDFVANLEASGWFKKPVDIVGTKAETDPKSGELVDFTIKGTINNPEAPPAPPAPAGSAKK